MEEIRLSISEQLQSIKNAHKATKKKITIIGAGMAGLVAAYELERLGNNVEVIEASERIGGRIWTHYFGDGPNAPYGELGAMRIPGNHEYTHHYIKAMGLADKLRPFVTIFGNENCFLDINGRVCRIKERREKLYPYYTFREDIQCQHPRTKLVASALRIAVDALCPLLLRNRFDREMNGHLLKEIDQLLLRGMIDEQIIEADVPTLVGAFELKGRWSESIDVFLRDVMLESSRDLHELEGGMAQLPAILAEKLNGRIWRNIEVCQISIVGDQIELILKEDNSLQAKMCDYVLCTIPFSVMREMSLKGFSNDKLEAIASLSYANASKVLLLCKERFWEKEKYAIHGGASVSDQVLRQTYYPSSSNKQGNLNGRDSTQSPGVLVGSYVIGEDTKPIVALEPLEQVALVKKKLSRFHPEISEAGMIIDHITICWEQYKWARGACCAMWKNEESSQDKNDRQIGYNELKRIYQNSIKPEGRLFFAGEHCSNEQAWIEGAIKSSLKAVRGIVAA